MKDKQKQKEAKLMAQGAKSKKHTDNQLKKASSTYIYKDRANSLAKKVIALYEKKQKALKQEYEDTKKTDKYKTNSATIDEKFEKKYALLEYKKINKMNILPKGELRIKNNDGALISVKNVYKSYPNRSTSFHALKDVSLDIKKGEFVVIHGPSGSGKTTLLNVISGLDRPTFGEVIINNKNLGALTDKETTIFRRNNIGYVFQSYNLLSTLSVSDNVEIGRSLQSDRSKRLDIDEILKEIGVYDQRNKQISELSGGQQQRVSIARAISKNPMILIGDEPTGALDTKSKVDVFRLLKQINKKYNTTVIIITHDPSVAQIADKVIKVLDSEIAAIEINKKPASADKLVERDKVYEKNK